MKEQYDKSGRRSLAISSRPLGGPSASRTPPISKILRVRITYRGLRSGGTLLIRSCHLDLWKYISKLRTRQCLALSELGSAGLARRLRSGADSTRDRPDCQLHRLGWQCPCGLCSHPIGWIFLRNCPKVLVDPAYQGKGIGKQLMDLAWETSPTTLFGVASGNEGVSLTELGFDRSMTSFVKQKAHGGTRAEIGSLVRITISGHEVNPSRATARNSAARS